jgi:hypothetical protein
MMRRPRASGVLSLSFMLVVGLALGGAASASAAATAGSGPRPAPPLTPAQPAGPELATCTAMPSLTTGTARYTTTVSLTVRAAGPDRYELVYTFAGGIQRVYDYVLDASDGVQPSVTIERIGGPQLPIEQVAFERVMGSFRMTGQVSVNALRANVGSLAPVVALVRVQKMDGDGSRLTLSSCAVVIPAPEPPSQPPPSPPPAADAPLPPA